MVPLKKAKNNEIDVGDDELKMKKRLYIRKKMQQYREEEKNEMNALKLRIFELENEIIRLNKPNVFRLSIKPTKEYPQALTWKDISIGLREARDEIVFENRALKAKVNKKSKVLIDLRNWVASAVRMQHVLNPICKSWRNVSLLKDPISRRTGKDWITTQLYYNTNDIYRYYQFPNDAMESDFCVNEVVFTDSFFDTVHCRQMVLNVPFEYLSHAMHGRNIWAIFMHGVLDASEIDVGVQRDINILHHTMTLRDENANVLSREFLEDDRCVFVGQQIHDDEAVPGRARQRNRRFWVELQRIGPNHTRMRNLYVISQSFTNRGFISLEDEAMYWGCDLRSTPEFQREEVFKRHANTFIMKQYNAGVEKFSSLSLAAMNRVV